MTLRQFPAILLLLSLLLIFGCSDENGRGDGAVAKNLEAERASVNALFEPVTDEAEEQSFHTPKDQLVETKQKLEGLRTRFERLPRPTELEMARLEATQQELARVNAALQVQEARTEWEKLLREANLSKKEQALPLDAKRALLRQQWPKFRIADDKVIAAERSFTDASNNLSAALKKIQMIEESG